MDVIYLYTLSLAAENSKRVTAFHTLEDAYNRYLANATYYSNGQKDPKTQNEMLSVIKESDKFSDTGYFFNITILRVPLL